jgi:hypothetical protein
MSFTFVVIHVSSNRSLMSYLAYCLAKTPDLLISYFPYCSWNKVGHVPRDQLCTTIVNLHWHTVNVESHVIGYL